MSVDRKEPVTPALDVVVRKCCQGQKFETGEWAGTPRGDNSRWKRRPRGRSSPWLCQPIRCRACSGAVRAPGYLGPACVAQGKEIAILGVTGALVVRHTGWLNHSFLKHYNFTQRLREGAEAKGGLQGCDFKGPPSPAHLSQTPHSGLQFLLPLPAPPSPACGGLGGALGLSQVPGELQHLCCLFTLWDH